MKIVTVIGARPQFIKAATLSRAISIHNSQPDNLAIEEKIIHTGQHYDNKMSKVFFDDLDMPKPNHNLNAGGGSHAKQTAEIMIGCEKYFLENNPDLIIVYGDVNSCVAASLVASKMFIPIVHIESGLRSGDKAPSAQVEFVDKQTDVPLEEILEDSTS